LRPDLGGNLSRDRHSGGGFDLNSHGKTPRVITQV
jgi:hypothetical protein